MSERAGLRLTRHGAGVLVVGVSLVVGGVVSGYTEFVVFGCIALLVLALALGWPVITSAVRLRRVEVPRLVGRGESMRILLVASSARPAPSVRVIDQFAGVAIPVTLPAMRADSPVHVRYELLALRRGVFPIGPLLEERRDPFGLASRAVEHEVVDEVLVHPKIHPLWLMDRGARQLESRMRVQRFSDDPLADFRSLREYNIGDDDRMIHWPTVARTGTLMVRDHFELRRTTRTVILETLDRAATPAQFEDAVEIAASLVCESIERRIPVVARTRDPREPGSSQPVKHKVQALEMFARVARTTADATLELARLQLGRNETDQIFVITGAGSPLPQQLAAAGRIAQRLVVVRVDDGPELPRVSTIRCIDVHSAEAFVHVWNGGRVQ